MQKDELRQQLEREVESLSPAQLQKLLNFARQVKQAPRGTPGHTLRPLRGTLCDEEARQMMADIEEGCGQIECESWK